ncbi:hypothetical protein GCM10022209_60230 [Chitinophaga oryziterrae]
MGIGSLLLTLSDNNTLNANMEPSITLVTVNLAGRGSAFNIILFGVRSSLS